MARLRGQPAFPHRDEQCPRRGSGLNHVVDASPVCVFCGQTTGREVRRRVLVKTEPTFSDKERRDLEFLRWLWVRGRI